MTEETDVTAALHEKLIEATDSLEISEDAAEKKKKNKKKKKNPDLQNAENLEGQTEEAATEENGEKNEDGDKAAPAKKKKNKNKKKTGKTQTDPPSLPVSQLFPDGNFPEGQLMDHPIAANDQKAKSRFTSEEARAVDRLQLDMYNEIRQVYCCRHVSIHITYM